MFGTAGQTVKLYLSILKRRRIAGLVIVLLLVIASIGQDIVAPYFVAKTLDVLAGFSHNHQAINQAKQLFVYFLITSLLALALYRVLGFWANRRQAMTVRDIENYLFEKLTLHSYAFFANRFAGALVTQSRRFVRSYQNLEDLWHWSLIGLITRLVASLVVLIYTIPVIGLALLAWAGFFIITLTWMVVKKQPYTQRASETDTFITARLADVITNILNLKSSGRRKDEVSGWRKLADKRRRIQRHSWTIDEMVWSYTHILGVVFAIVTLWLSIELVANGSATLTLVLLAQFYIARISGDLSQLPGYMSQISISLSEAAEMTRILQTSPEIKDPKRPKRLAVKRGAVQFDDLTFAYEKSKPVFKDFTLDIKPGSRVGLVGRSGSGKTTLTKLLLRFVEAQQGRVTIDGQTVDSVAQDDLRSHIAYVPQEPILFHRSLEENIRYSRPDASDVEVQRVAKLAHATEFIESLPDGYGTMVGERGIKLSGGEKQRVAIARAMLSQAPILVLDEATSSLDSESEKLITDALKQLMKRRTTLVIAHRLSTIRNLDQIVVMDHGKIVGQGFHKYLLQHCALYKELWKHQTGGFLDD